MLAPANGALGICVKSVLLLCQQRGTALYMRSIQTLQED